MARTIEVRPEEHPVTAPRSHVEGLILVCCIPVLVIAVVLLAAGGTRPGFMVPALTSGVVIGMLMFITLREPPRG